MVFNLLETILQFPTFPSTRVAVGDVGNYALLFVVNLISRMVGEMASEWKNAGFRPEFSFVVLGVALGLAALAFIVGFLSVRLVPRKRATRSEQYLKGAIPPSKRKVESLREEYHRRIENRPSLRRNSVVITMTSNAFSFMLACVMAVVFASVFCKEHYAGLAQLFINTLADNDDAVWGDFITLFVLAIIAGVYGFGLLFLISLGENTRARMLAEQFLKDKFVPFFAQDRSVFYIAYLLFYAIKSDIVEWRDSRSHTTRAD